MKSATKKNSREVVPKVLETGCKPVLLTTWIIIDDLFLGWDIRFYVLSYATIKIPSSQVADIAKLKNKDNT